jgi:hypothetical protein
MIHLREVKIFEFSLVLKPVNPHATVKIVDREQ